MITIKKKLESLGFPIGSRVVLVSKDPTGYVEIGSIGTVCHYTSEWERVDGCNVGVEWDDGSYRYHDCMGRCKRDHGRYVPHTCITLERVDLGEFDPAEFSIETLFQLNS